MDNDTKQDIREIYDRLREHEKTTNSIQMTLAELDATMIHNAETLKHLEEYIEKNNNDVIRRFCKLMNTPVPGQNSQIYYNKLEDFMEKIIKRGDNMSAWKMFFIFSLPTAIIQAVVIAFLMIRLGI